MAYDELKNLPEKTKDEIRKSNEIMTALKIYQFGGCSLERLDKNLTEIITKYEQKNKEWKQRKI